MTEGNKKSSCAECTHFGICVYNLSVKYEVCETTYKKVGYGTLDKTENNVDIIEAIMHVSEKKVGEKGKLMEDFTKALVEAVDIFLAPICQKYMKPPFGKEIKRE